MHLWAESYADLRINLGTDVLRQKKNGKAMSTNTEYLRKEWS